MNSLFPHPNTQSDADCPKSGTVYEISCTNCNFVYYGQTEQTLKTWIAEYKRVVATCMFDHDSKMYMKTPIKWISMLTKLLDISLTSTSDFFGKLRGQLRIRSLGTITSPSQRSTNPWLVHQSCMTFALKLYMPVTFFSVRV